MRNQGFVGGVIFAAFSLSISSPASAQTPWDGSLTRTASATQSAAMKWELGYLALSAVDAAQTISCLNRNICEEGNPLFGKHPSATKLVAAKVGLGLLHFAMFNRMNERNPKKALRLAQMSLALQGSVVGLNARLTFK